ncbi:unnamed protein product [Ilex paraguariensis]|uniref:RRM domain-containing protein n=1 Tax=Ilex paraguariensis TaxID=185542 RepID=A0ABC8TAB2_9AQUA
MASSSGHRCVFVGNIPYDATEEQLVQICEEVGPVVSFRFKTVVTPHEENLLSIPPQVQAPAYHCELQSGLVIDRETGKPKGYGFCEYKDEETALSARRNLQGYEINGRQLRVDFAENDKNSNGNREQGRGGPGMVSSIDPQKQFGGPAILGDAGLKQPIGLSVAMAAASLMAGALGGPQIGSNSNQSGHQGQAVLGTDLLTLHLAKMSRNQLNEIISEMKVMATQKPEQARQLLLASPQLPKALLQAQIMLGMVTPQMLQMQNIRQASGSLLKPLLQDGEQGQRPEVQNLPGLPFLLQNKMQFGVMPQSQEGQVNQYLLQLPTRPHIQLPQLTQHQVLQQGPLPGQSGVSTLPSVRMQWLGDLSVRPQIQVANSSSLKQEVEPLLHGPLGNNAQLVGPNAPLQPSLLIRPLLSDHGFQDSNRPPQVTNDSTWSHRVDTYPSLSSDISEKADMVCDILDPMKRPSKLVKLEDGRRTTFLGPDVNGSAVSGPSQVFGLSGNQKPKPQEALDSEKQAPQSRLNDIFVHLSSMVSSLKMLIMEQFHYDP